MSKIGCIYTVRFRYFDIRQNKMSAKQRPFLIIKEENSTHPKDLSALPISSVSNKNRLDIIYDLEVNSKIYPKLNLNNDISYIRTGKVQTINEKDLIRKVCDNFETTYPDLYKNIKDKVQEYFVDIL